MEKAAAKQKTTVKTRTIQTNLIGKLEVFRMLALARAAGLPLLLIGPAGTSKTACVLDYAKSEDSEQTLDNTYILETDEGTRTSEIKGTLDVKSLVMANEYKMNTPIANAKYVIINEVDKASSGLRNAMLGVMNEKMLMNGEHKIACNWELFVATANKIPKEEEGNPFWDRFMLKYTSSRVSAAEMMKYYEGGDKGYSSTHKVADITEEDIAGVNIPLEKLEIFLGHVREKCSDRTLSFVPRLVKIITLIWNTTPDNAFVKLCSLMTGDAALAKELDKKMGSKEKRQVMDKIDMLPGIQDESQLNNTVKEIENLVNGYQNAGKLTSIEVDEIVKIVEGIMESHPLVNPEGVEA